MKPQYHRPCTKSSLFAQIIRNWARIGARFLNFSHGETWKKLQANFLRNILVTEACSYSRFSVEKRVKICTQSCITYMLTCLPVWPLSSLYEKPHHYRQTTQQASSYLRSSVWKEAMRPHVHRLRDASSRQPCVAWAAFEEQKDSLHTCWEGMDSWAVVFLTAPTHTVVVTAVHISSQGSNSLTWFQVWMPNLTFHPQC